MRRHGSGDKIDGVAFEGKSSIGQINVDDYPSIAQQYGVSGIPTFLVFKGGVLKHQDHRQSAASRRLTDLLWRCNDSRPPRGLFQRHIVKSKRHRHVDQSRPMVGEPAWPAQTFGAMVHNGHFLGANAVSDVNAPRGTLATAHLLPFSSSRCGKPAFNTLPDAAMPTWI